MHHYNSCLRMPLHVPTLFTRYSMSLMPRNAKQSCNIITDATHTSRARLCTSQTAFGFMLRLKLCIAACSSARRDNARKQKHQIRSSAVSVSVRIFTRPVLQDNFPIFVSFPVRCINTRSRVSRGDSSRISTHC